MTAQASLDLGDGPLATSNARIARDVAELGKEGAERGIRSSAQHAEHDEPGWQDNAVAALLAYREVIRDGRFVCPAVRKWAIASGRINASRDAHSWGAVMRRAARDGLIRRAGHIAYGDETIHTHEVNAWQFQ